MAEIVTLNDDGTTEAVQTFSSPFQNNREIEKRSNTPAIPPAKFQRQSFFNPETGSNRIPIITLESDEEETASKKLSKLVSSATLESEQKVLKQLDTKTLMELSAKDKKVILKRVKRQSAELISGKVVMFEQNKIYKTEHECSFSCLISNPRPTNKCFSDISPLYIPCTLGWKREISIMKNNLSKDVQKFVIYTSPCGKSFFNHRSIYNYLTVTKSALSVEYFCFDISVEPSRMVKLPPEFILASDITKGKELFPVEVINTIDYEEVPKMEYITERQFTESVKNVVQTSRNACSGCSCEDDCVNSSKCECQKLTAEGMRSFLNRDCKIFGYANRSLEDKVLTGIYECNSFCKCSKNRCPNRVVQFPPRFPLQLFRTALKGWGVRAVTDIPKGAFITNFVGQIHSQDSIHEVPKFIYSADIDYIDTIEKQKKDAWLLYQKRRGAPRSEVSSHKNGVDWSSYFEGEEQLFTIDPSVKGNLARYLNHSCSPNIFTQFVFVDTHDIRLPWVSFFTNTNIKAGEELSWDYDYEITSENSKSSYCFCGSGKCSGKGVLKF